MLNIHISSHALHALDDVMLVLITFILATAEAGATTAICHAMEEACRHNSVRTMEEDKLCDELKPHEISHQHHGHQPRPRHTKADC